MPGTCASECILDRRIQKQHRYCDKREEKEVDRAHPSCSIAPIRFTDIVLRVKHPHTSWSNAENGLRQAEIEPAAAHVFDLL
jgi:hypothetical protein